MRRISRSLTYSARPFFRSPFALFGNVEPIRLPSASVTIMFFSMGVNPLADTFSAVMTSVFFLWVSPPSLAACQSNKADRRSTRRPLSYYRKMHFLSREKPLQTTVKINCDTPKSNTKSQWYLRHRRTWREPTHQRPDAPEYQHNGLKTTSQTTFRFPQALSSLQHTFS